MNTSRTSITCLETQRLVNPKECDSYLSIVTDRSPQAWSPARTNEEPFSFGGEEDPLPFVPSLKIIGFSKESTCTKELLTSFNMVGDSTRHVTVFGILKLLFSDLEREFTLAISSKKNKRKFLDQDRGFWDKHATTGLATNHIHRLAKAKQLAWKHEANFANTRGRESISTNDPLEKQNLIN